ncbi:MAG: OmpA family protein [Thiogranum sp.]|nr:OmpA family protein [Thiogranum sp.]
MSWENSSWSVENSARHCALVHEIPRFGQVRFEQSSGRRMQFSLLVDQPLVRDQTAKLRSESPPWQHRSGVRSLGEFELPRGRSRLELPRDQTLRLYSELGQGRQPVFEFTDRGDGKGQIEVVLVPVRFRAALSAFEECTAALFSLDFEPLTEEAVYFGTASDVLDFQARKTLEAFARQARKQPNVRVVLGGFSDARGDERYNLELSRRRAAMVTRFLRSRGLSGKLIETRIFGARESVDPAKNASTWASNRRVTLWLASQ